MTARRPLPPRLPRPARGRPPAAEVAVEGKAAAAPTTGATTSAANRGARDPADFPRLPAGSALAVSTKAAPPPWASASAWHLPPTSHRWPMVRPSPGPRPAESIRLAVRPPAAELAPAPSASPSPRQLRPVRRVKGKVGPTEQPAAAPGPCLALLSVSDVAPAGGQTRRSYRPQSSKNPAQRNSKDALAVPGVFLQNQSAPP